MPTASSRSPVRVRMAAAAAVAVAVAVTVRAATRAISPSRRRRYRQQARSRLEVVRTTCRCGTGGEECRVQLLGPDGEALGVAADAREPVLEDAAREELVGDLRDDGATRAILAGEAVAVDRLLALGCISRRGRFGILSDL